jgi:hypothetical protein
VEQLFGSEVWNEIVLPLLKESVAGVSGRFTNGRFHRGALTRDAKALERLCGYQAALEDFHNNLTDFVTARDEQEKKRKEEAVAKKAPLINPFLEDHHDGF